jgi:adenylosuccinate synthase
MCDTTKCRTWSDLPAAARTYLEWVEAQVGVPIVTVSVGAAREAEVRRA